MSDPVELKAVIESGALSMAQAVRLADEDDCLCDACEYHKGYGGGKGVDGSYECVKYLLSIGCDVNKWNADAETTPVGKAFVASHYDKVRLLLENGADLKAEGPDGQRAVTKGQIEKNCPEDLKALLVEAGVIKK